MLSHMQYVTHVQANTRWSKAVLMLGRRRGRRANNKTTLD